MFKNYPYYLNTDTLKGIEGLITHVEISGVSVLGHDCYKNNDNPDHISAYYATADGLAHCFADASLGHIERLRAEVCALAETYGWIYTDETRDKYYPFSLNVAVQEADMLVKGLIINKTIPIYDKNLHLQAETLQRQAIAIRCLSMYLRHEAGATHKVLAKELNVTKARIQQLVKIGKQLYVKGQSDVSKTHDDPVFNESEFKE